MTINLFLYYNLPVASSLTKRLDINEKINNIHNNERYEYIWWS